jgi:carboxyl-terminal processing protease
MYTKKTVFAIIFCFSLLFQTTAQDFNKAAQNAYVITRMAKKFHLQPKEVNQAFSNSVFDLLLNKLDDEKLIFCEDDIAFLERYKLSLHVEINSQKTNFINQLYKVYSKKLSQLDSLVNVVEANKINLTSIEKITTKADTTFPKDIAAQKLLLYKNIKDDVVEAVAEIAAKRNFNKIPQQFLDSIEPIFRKKICASYKRNIQISKQLNGGLVSYLSNAYCDAIANTYDPHTSFFSEDEKENFESMLGKKNYVFGFTIDDKNDDGVTIQNIQPGSAAFKTGQINKDDKFISIQWEGQSAIDVSKATASEISTILSNNNHAKATIVFQKADGTKVEVVLSKAMSTSDEDDEKVTSYILNGSKKMGYISLPAFYDDWENDANVNGCSNDVAKEILKLKKENIEGLIVDLRYNGGGSLYEAVDLTGLFIDAGPIIQVKGKEPKVSSIKDISRGTMYDGPLIVLINGFSASASELVAGALQDYNRALIVGSASYGKATGQLVYPMDTTIEMENLHKQTSTGSAIKITNLQIFQVSGKTAQFTGVVPDVVLPTTTELYNKREAYEPFAIPSSNIAANKFYNKLTPLNIEEFKQKAKLFEAEDNYFQTLTNLIKLAKEESTKKEREINLEKLVQQYINNNKKANLEKEDSTNTTPFTVNANAQSLEREKTNNELVQMNAFNIKRLQKDPYVQVAFKLLLQMK